MTEEDIGRILAFRPCIHTISLLRILAFLYCAHSTHFFLFLLLNLIMISFVPFAMYLLHSNVIQLMIDELGCPRVNATFYEVSRVRYTFKEEKYVYSKAKGREYTSRINC